MTDYTALSNDELSRAVAERCGWFTRPTCRDENMPHRYPPEPEHWHSPGDDWPCHENYDRRSITMPYPYATSMDAILAPGGPMAWLEEHPDLKYMGLYRDGGAFRWECEVFLGIREVMRHSATMPRAFCLAFMAATEPDGGGVA